MTFNEIEFKEKTRLKREKKFDFNLPVLETKTAFSKYNNKIIEKTYHSIEYKKQFVYLGKKVRYNPYIDNINDRFALTWVDLIGPQDLLDLQDEDFQAFGVFLPKSVILELIDFHKNHNDEFSLFVKQYPFSPLVFSQWLTIKLYQRHKELTQNPKLDYQSFMQENFSFHYEGKQYNIYQAIHLVKVQELNNKEDTDYLISTFFSEELEILSLYDFLYDLIPNSIKRVFLKDIQTMKAYLPLKQEEFFYQEIEYQIYEWKMDKDELLKKIFKDLYGPNKTYNEDKVPKQYYLINALHLRGYTIEQALIPKAKEHKLGIGYDELYEMLTRSEKDLEYPMVWSFKAELMGFEKDYEGRDDFMAPIYKMVFGKKYRANYEDIIRISYSFTDYDYIGRDAFHIGEEYYNEKISRVIDKQYLDANALLVQNNFYTSNTIFESWRMKVKEDEEFREELKDSDIVSLQVVIDTPMWFSQIFICNAKLSFRFNQALALAFLNAYAPKQSID